VRRRVVVALTWGLCMGLVACEESIDTTIGFEPGGEIGATPFPSDTARTQATGQWLLDGFNEAQLTEMAFLDQLRISDVEGYSAITRIRIPFTRAGQNTDIKVDLATAPDGIRLYDVTGDSAERRDLGEFRIRLTTSAITCRPAVPLAPGGTYAIALLGAKLKTRAGGAVNASEVYAGIQSAGDPATDGAFAKVQAADGDIASRRDTIGFFQFTVADHVSPVLLLRDAVMGTQEVSHAGARHTMGLTSFDADDRMLAITASLTLAREPAQLEEFFGALPHDAVGRVVKGYFSGPHIMSDYDGSDPDRLHNFQTLRPENIDAPLAADNPPALSNSAPYRTLPYLLFMPSAWPEDGNGELAPLDVVVALHGFEGSKEDWTAMANAVTSTGKALIAVDIYQHGERQDSVAYPEGHTSKKIDEAVEVDAPGTDFPDPFLNPTFLKRSRAKFLQTAVDVMALMEILKAGDCTTGLVDINGDGRNDNIGSISLVGMSLGAMLGTVIGAVSPHVDRLALYAPGGGVADLSRDSEVLGLPLTLLILATSDIEPFGLLAGSGRAMLIDRPEREVYGVVVDAIMAPVEPANYGQALVSGALRGDDGARVLMQLTDFDLLIPNNASDRIARAMAAGGAEGEVAVVDSPAQPQLFEMSIPTTTDAAGLKGVVSHYPGQHGVLLDFVDPAATAAAQAEAAAFLAAP